MVETRAKPVTSIRTKLVRLVLVALGLAFLLGGTIAFWQVLTSYAEMRRQTMLTVANGIAALSAPLVAHADKDGTERLLRSLGRTPHFVRGAVIGPNRRIIAESGSAVRLDGDLDLIDGAPVSIVSMLVSRTIGIVVPIIHQGEEVGRLTLVRDTDDLPSEVLSWIGAFGLITAITLLTALLLVGRLQRGITDPLLRLTEVMTTVEATGQYRPASSIRTDDEVGLLAHSFDSMMREIERKTIEILARENEIIERLSRAGEQRDDQTGQHVVRVAQISRIIAEDLGLEPQFIDDLVRASPMHDVGKISVSDQILFKPGRLDPEERREMEQHAIRGYEVLAGSQSRLVQLASEIALTHHERWDGQGYPQKIAGAAIPLSGRITAVADVCDALLSDRPYKKAWSFEEVRSHLAENAGKHFDPDCVGALLRCWSQLTAVYRSRDESTLAST